MKKDDVVEKVDTWTSLRCIASPLKREPLHSLKNPYIMQGDYTSKKTKPKGPLLVDNGGVIGHPLVKSLPSSLYRKFNQIGGTYETKEV